MDRHCANKSDPPCRVRRLARGWAGAAGIAALFISGCATIPAEAPSLSAELGGRIKESRTTHEQVVRLFVNEKRAAVDRFIMTQWVPVFAKQVFDVPVMRDTWTKVAQSQDTTARLEFIKGLGPILQEQINAKRMELVAPLDEMEQGIIRRLEDHYNEMLAMNSALTGLLASGAKASETQQSILKGLKAESALRDALGKTEDVAKLLTKGLESYEKNKDKIDALVKAVK